jgi:hypothetical protein
MNAHKGDALGSNQKATQYTSWSDLPMDLNYRIQNVLYLTSKSQQVRFVYEWSFHKILILHSSLTSIRNAQDLFQRPLKKEFSAEVLQTSIIYIREIYAFHLSFDIIKNYEFLEFSW